MGFFKDKDRFLEPLLSRKSYTILEFMVTFFSHIKKYVFFFYNALKIKEKQSLETLNLDLISNIVAVSRSRSSTSSVKEESVDKKNKIHEI